MRNVLSFEVFFESIWLKIPPVWREADSEYGKPLQILTLTLAQHFYYSFYLKIAAMDELFDPDMCPDKYLPFLASMVGWKLLGKDVNSWRSQIRHAPLLYKIKGTRRSVTIAEKLIGYSVFMTELYRDYTGLIVPKEKIFNTVPVHIKIKPWFRKTAQDLSGVVCNELDSNQFPSYIEGINELNESGELVISKTLRRVSDRKVTIPSSDRYNPITGEGSLARFAKLPRLNIVLKKDTELDSGESNLSEAIDLLMQFKPFHVYINDMVVMYDVSDYIFGTSANKDAGSGISGDTILSRDYADIYVSAQEQESIQYYNSDTFIPPDEQVITSVDSSRFKGLLETKILNIPIAGNNPGVSIATETNGNYLLGLGLSLSGYSKNTILSNNKNTYIWNKSDFDYIDSIPVFPSLVARVVATSNVANFADTPLVVGGIEVTNSDIILVIGQDTPSENGLYYVSSAIDGTWARFDSSRVGIKSGMIVEVTEGDGSGQYILATPGPITVGTTALTFNTLELSSGIPRLDIATNSICYDTLIPKPDFSFVSLPANLAYITSLASLFNDVLEEDSFKWFSTLSVGSVNLSKSHQDTIIIDSISYNYASASPVPVSLRGVNVFNSISAGILNNEYRTYKVKDGISTQVIELINSQDQILRLLAKQNVIVLLTTSQNTKLLLVPKYHYAFDFANNKIVLNEKTIVDTLTEYSISDTLFDDSTINILYPALVPTIVDVLLDPSELDGGLDFRSAQLANVRDQHQFSRITYIDNSDIQLKIDSAHYSPNIEFYDSIGALAIDKSKTKLFKEPAKRIFTRNSLHSEDTGTSYKAVSYDSFVCRDTSKWKVFTDVAPSIYAGSTRVSKTIWADYFNVPYSANLVDYSSIDMTGNNQIITRATDRWRQTFTNIKKDNPLYFAASRLNADAKTTIWTRGSAQTLPIPYISTSRDSIQAFRTGTLFNRTESLSDYSASLLVNYGTDRYKYTQNGSDVTGTYRNASIDSSNNCIPQTEVRDTENKTSMSLSGKITYPITLTDYTTQYETPYEFTDRSTYYNNNILKPSVYAANLRTDMSPYTGELLGESADTLGINVVGLTQIRELFVKTNEADTDFALSNIDIYVVWNEVNTGNSMGIGIFPIADYSKVRPNVSVSRNGIQVPYGSSWVLASNPNRLVLLDSGNFSVGDTIEIVYFAMSTVTYSNLYPTDPETGIVYDLGSIEQFTDTNTVTDFQVDYILYKIPLANRAVIAWYRSDTAAYISTSVDRGNSPIAPNPAFNQQLANPNIQVRKNGVLLPYQYSWHIIAIPRGAGLSSYNLVMSYKETQLLQPGDIIEIRYTGLI